MSLQTDGCLKLRLSGFSIVVIIGQMGSHTHVNTDISTYACLSVWQN